MVQAPFICRHFSKSGVKAWLIKYLEEGRKWWWGVVIAQKTMDRSIKVSERGAHQLKPLSLVFEQATFSPPVSGSPKQTSEEKSSDLFRKAKIFVSV